MSKWIEERGGGETDQILEGHGTKFVVRFVSYPKLQYWRIKESPFLLDVNKRFAALSEAKEYCERRYKELFGTTDEIARLRANNEKLRETLKPFAERMKLLEKCKNAAKYGFSTDIEIEHLRHAKEVYEDTK